MCGMCVGAREGGIITSALFLPFLGKKRANLMKRHFALALVGYVYCLFLSFSLLLS